MRTIQGLVVLADATNGRPLAIIESSALTAVRTAAAAALAAKYGARAHSRIAALIGCGMQARYQLAAFRAVFSLEEVRLYDIDPAKAEDFAKMAGELCRPVETVSEALEGADICITCTTATGPSWLKISL